MLVFRVEAEAVVPYPCFEISQITEIETGVLIFFFTCLTINNLYCYIPYMKTSNHLKAVVAS